MGDHTLLRLLLTWGPSPSRTTARFLLSRVRLATRGCLYLGLADLSVTQREAARHPLTCAHALLVFAIGEGIWGRQVNHWKTYLTNTGIRPKERRPLSYINSGCPKSTETYFKRQDERKQWCNWQVCTVSKGRLLKLEKYWSTLTGRYFGQGCRTNQYLDK